MAKFVGAIGYGENVETAPDVWQLVITERQVVGDVQRNTRRYIEGENLNKDMTVNNMLSVIADPYLQGHFHQIKYVRWMGGVWDVREIEVQYPRLLLRLGGVYNGQQAETQPTA